MHSNHGRARDHLIIGHAQDDFIRLYEKRTGGSLIELERRRSNIETELRGLRRHLGQLREKRSSDRKKIGGLQQQEQMLTGRLRNIEIEIEANSLTREMVREMFRRMIETPRVVGIDVDVDNETIGVITDTLYGRDKVGQWYIFRPIRGDIMLPRMKQNGQPTGHVQLVWSCPRNATGHNERMAPQVVCGGTACLGKEATTAFNDALLKHDYAGMVAIVPRFAECFGGTFLQEWRKVHLNEVPEWYVKTFGA